MGLVCKRLPGNDETLKFLSPHFLQKHVQDGIDDRWRTYYGIYDMFRAISDGRIRAYGVFDISEPMRFLGFVLGWLSEDGETFEVHAFWERGVPTATAIDLCKPVVKEDYAKDGIRLKYAAGYIPDRNRAAKWMAIRSGANDLGAENSRKFYKGDYIFPCREYRFEW